MNTCQCTVTRHSILIACGCCKKYMYICSSTHADIKKYYDMETHIFSPFNTAIDLSFKNVSCTRKDQGTLFHGNNEF